MARKVSIDVVVDADRVNRGFRSIRSGAEGLNSSLGRLTVGFGQLVKGVLVIDAVQKAMEGLSETVHIGIEEFKENTQIQAQTQAAIKSTGGVAHVTAKQVDELGQSLSNLSGVDDEVIRQGENVLLAFQNIRNFAGKGNQIFTEATKASLDFAVRSGRSVQAAAVAVGRALQDPAKAAGSLRRAYVVLTDAEKKAIDQAVKHGDELKAQRLIISDLEKRYGGAAKAAGQTLAGQVNVLRERFKDLAGSIVGETVPALTKVVTAITNIVRSISTARTFTAKLNIVWTGIKEAGRGAQDALGRAVASVDWKAVWAKANGIADGLAARLGSVDWKAVGVSIGTGIANAISVAASATKKIAQKLEAIFKAIDFVKLGKAMGPGLAAAVVTAFVTLTDPTFWIKNWDLALAVALTVFGGTLFKVFGKFAEPLARIGTKIAGDLALSIAAAFERFGPRISGSVLEVLIRLPRIAARALAPLTDIVKRAFDRLSPLTRFVVKVLGIQAVIDSIAGLVQRIAEPLKKVGRIVLSVTGIGFVINEFRTTFDVIGALITGRLDKAWKELKVGAIRAVLGIIEPFTHLPKQLGGGPFQQMKTELQGTLREMEAAAATGGRAIRTTLVQNIALSATQGLGPHHDLGFGAALAAAANTQTPAGSGPDKLPAAPSPTPPRSTRAGITASQRNTFFDNQIARILLRGGLGSLKQQLAALEEASRLIAARIAVTKDITRKLNLEDQLLQLASQEKDLRAQLRQAFVDAVTAKEFKQLGLSATGDDLVPGVKNLRKRLGTISDAVKGTFLDTPKLETLLKRIRKVLSEGLVPKDVRAKIKEMFDTIRDELNNQSGNLTKFAHTNSAAILSGLGLTPEQIRALRSRIAQVGIGGTVPGSATPAFSLAGANTIVMNNPSFHGVTDVREFKNQLAKETGRRSGSRRGPYAGRH